MYICVPDGRLALHGGEAGSKKETCRTHLKRGKKHGTNSAKARHQHGPGATEGTGKVRRPASLHCIPLLIIVKSLEAMKYLRFLRTTEFQLLTLTVFGGSRAPLPRSLFFPPSYLIFLIKLYYPLDLLYWGSGVLEPTLGGATYLPFGVSCKISDFRLPLEILAIQFFLWFRWKDGRGPWSGSPQRE